MEGEKFNQPQNTNESGEKKPEAIPEPVLSPEEIRRKEEAEAASREAAQAQAAEDAEKIKVLHAELGIESAEKPKVTKEQVVEAIDAQGIESPEVVELVTKYYEQLTAEEKKKNPDGTDEAILNEAVITVQLKMAEVYEATHDYKFLALETLEEAYQGLLYSEGMFETKKNARDRIAALKKELKV